MRASDIQENKDKGSQDERKSNKKQNCTKADAKTETNKEV